jgi:glutamate racemase
MEYKNTSNNTNRPIAFFDSGVGGLTVFQKVKQLLPNENYLYFGDTKNMPYGEKSQAQLIEFSDRIFRFFERNNAKAVVMACNTTSAMVYESVKNKYNFKIYPIIQTVCSKIANLEGVKRLCVIATPATIKSQAYSKEIAKYNSDVEVFELAAPQWVRIVEEHRINQPQSIFQVKEILDEAQKFAPDKIVLACTHYPYLIDVLKKFRPENSFVDPAVYFAKEILQDLRINNLLGNKHEFEKFYVSSEPENFKIASKMFYELKDLPELFDK